MIYWYHITVKGLCNRSKTRKICEKLNATNWVWYMTSYHHDFGMTHTVKISKEFNTREESEKFIDTIVLAWNVLGIDLEY